MLEQESFAERYYLGTPTVPVGSAPTMAPFDTRSPSKVTVSPTTPVKVQGHILVVDDEPLNREMLVRRLLRMGFTAGGAENGREALEILSRESFDLVLLDILMPVLDGFQTLERLSGMKNCGTSRSLC